MYHAEIQKIAFYFLKEELIEKKPRWFQEKK